MVHSDSSELEAKYPCPAEGCDYRTKHSWQVKNHMRIHTGEKPWACDRCSYRSADNSALAKHKRRHDNPAPYWCKACHLGCNTPNGFYRHMRTFHNRSETTIDLVEDMGLGPAEMLEGLAHKCDLCDAVCHSLMAYQKHYNKAHGKARGFKCKKCAYRGRHISSLQYHMKSHVDMESKSLGCDKCSFRTNHYAVLNRHCKLFHTEAINAVVKDPVKMQTRKPTGSWKCSQCDEVLATRELKAKHQREVHNMGKKKKDDYRMVPALIEGGAERFRCTRCMFECDGEAEVIEHAKKHFFRKHSCDLCSYKSIGLAALRKHKRNIHGIEPTKFNCTQCDFKSFKNSEYILHTKKNHPTPVERRCTQCSFVTTTASVMRGHENMHLGMFYPCPHCTYRAYEKADLINHQTMHPGAPKLPKSLKLCRESSLKPPVAVSNGQVQSMYIIVWTRSPSNFI